MMENAYDPLCSAFLETQKIYFYEFDGNSVTEKEGIRRLMPPFGGGYEIQTEDGERSYFRIDIGSLDVVSRRGMMWTWSYKKDIGNAIDMFIEYRERRLGQYENAIENEHNRIEVLKALKNELDH